MTTNENTLYTSGEMAGPSFRWGHTASIVTGTLSVLLTISLFSTELATNIISVVLQLIGATAVISYIVITISFLRLNLLKLILRYRGWAYHPRSPLTRMYLGNSPAFLLA